MKIVIPDHSKLLGRGGYSFVYEGLLGTAQISVAVKRVLLDDVDSACEQEEESLRKLNHLNVIKLFYAESDSNFRYYALELCEASLDKLFLEDGNEKKYRGPKPSIGDILIQLANGLKYIHEQKLVHRDVKPENVLIWVSPKIENASGKKEILMKWADFGLSKRVNERGTYTASAGIRGTEKWLAPEILKMMNDATLDRRGTNKSDVFAEGLTFGYILLEGKHLYGNHTEILHNISQNNPVNLKTIADIPEHGIQLHEILCDALKPHPNERLDAKEVFNRLQQIYARKNPHPATKGNNLVTTVSVNGIDQNAYHIEITKKPVDRRSIKESIDSAIPICKEIDRNECVEIAALGRRLGLRQLYDYRSDRTADDVLDFEYTLQVDDESARFLKLSIADSDIRYISDIPITRYESESEEVETPKVTPRKQGFPASPTSPMLEDESDLVRPNNEEKARSKKPIDFTAMLSFKGIDRNECIEIAALGRRLGLCQLYDYRSDRPADDVLDFEYSLQVDEVYDLKLEIADSESTSDKWEFMGLDDHLKASTVSGIIDKYTGASNYLNEKPDPSQVTRVLILRAITKKERLNLPSPVDYALVQSSAAQSSTHIVVGVTYGFQAYCVIHQNLENERERERTEEELDMLVEELKEALNEREDWTNFQDKLDREERRRLARTKCRLYADLQTQTVRQCNVSDMYRHFLLLLKEAVQQTNDGQSRAVPISISLCPLKHVIGRVKGAEKLLHYRDVDVDLVFCCCRLWSDLECITNEAMTFSAAANKSNKLSIDRFTEAIGKFSSLFRNDLKSAISRARGSEEGDDDELANVIDAAENHPLFKPSGLKRWLNYKRHELEMADNMSEIEGIIVLSDKKEVENELSTSFDLKYALVMWIPPLNGKTNEILQAMRNYVEIQTRVVPTMSDKDDEFSDEPWHMEQRRRSQIEDKIRKFAEHAVRNQSIENQVHFIVAFGEGNVKKFGCSYSVFEAKNVLKDNIDQLPGPPTNLRIQLAASGKTRNTKTSSLCVSWDYGNLGYPYHFVVEYRTKSVNGNQWTRQRTQKAGETQLIINVPTGSATEVRVAADTCIGCSEFSQVVDTESLDIGTDENSSAQTSEQEKQAKSRANVSSTQAQDESPITNRQQQGQQYYDNQAAIRKERMQRETPFSSTSAETLKSHSLKPTPFSSRLMGTTHQPVHTSSVRLSQSTMTRMTKAETQPSSSNASRGSGAQTAPRQELPLGRPTWPTPAPRSNVPAVSEHLKQIMFAPRKKAAANVRFAESIKEQCTCIGQRNGMHLYSVPLIKSGEIGTIAERYSFGRIDNSKMLRKTILVMGATGSGKTSLINGMINYIFDVHWEDPFRFQLISQEQEGGQSQSHSQTNKITAYDIYHQEGFRVPYSLTIVDTPGYGDTKGLYWSQEINNMVRQFFEDKGGIQELDVVGFVTPAQFPRLTRTQLYIYDSVLSIFGNDVKENINFLLTFADNQDPLVLKAIAESNLDCPVDAESGDPLHYKFNNAGFFCSNRDTGRTVDRFNKFYWQMGMERVSRNSSMC